MLVSACMIVKDEAWCLRECLQAITKFVDEIIVVDTGSVDDSQDIARSAGAKVIPGPSIRQGYDVCRNIALEHASCEWILRIDADEQIDDSSIPVIRDLLSEAEWFGARTHLHDYHGAGHWSCIDPLTFFRNDSRVRYKGSIHESVTGAIRGIEGTVTDLPVTVNHLDFLRPREAAESKVERYTQMTSKGSTGFPYDVLLGHQLAREGNCSAAEASFRQFLRESPNSPMGRQMLGDLLREQARYDEAIAEYETVLHLAKLDHPGSNLLVSSGDIRWTVPQMIPLEATNGIGLCHAMAEDDHLAATWFEQAVALFPNWAHPHINLGMIYDRMGWTQEATKSFRRALKLCKFLSNPVVETGAFRGPFSSVLEGITVERLCAD